MSVATLDHWLCCIGPIYDRRSRGPYTYSFRNNQVGARGGYYTPNVYTYRPYAPDSKMTEEAVYHALYQMWWVTVRVVCVVFFLTRADTQEVRPALIIENSLSTTMKENVWVNHFPLTVRGASFIGWQWWLCIQTKFASKMHILHCQQYYIYVKICTILLWLYWIVQ